MVTCDVSIEYLLSKSSIKLLTPPLLTIPLVSVDPCQQVLCMIVLQEELVLTVLVKLPSKGCLNLQICL